MTLLQALKFAKRNKRHKESNIHRISHADVQEVRKNLPELTIQYKNRRYRCAMVKDCDRRAGLIPVYEIGSPTVHAPLLGKVFYETWETVTRAYKHGIAIVVE